MKSIIYYTILLLVSLYMVQCKKSTDTTDPIVFNVETEFAVDLFEQINPTTAVTTPGLLVETIKSYNGCSNYTINYDIQVVAQKITVVLKSVEKPAICNNITGPARVFIPFGNLAYGDYTFHLELANTVKNVGTFTINDTKLQINLAKPAGIIILHPSMLRIPPSIAWGFTGHNNSDEHARALLFIDDLKNNSSVHGLAPGYYGYFTVTEFNTYQIHNPSPPSTQKELFLVKYDNTPIHLQNVLQSFRSNAVTPLIIKCLSSHGEL